MKYRTRTYYTSTQKALMWERWKEGWTLHQIGQLFDRPHTSIQTILSQTGGIRPPERRRSANALTLAERKEISRALMSSARGVEEGTAGAPQTHARYATFSFLYAEDGDPWADCRCRVDQRAPRIR